MIVPVILCGGNGTRLWPLSSSKRPKQLLPLFSDLSLCQQTALRFSEKQLPLILVCGKKYADLIEEQMQQINIRDYTLIIEPAPRDTAPAIALAAEIVLRKKPEASLLVVPSDHLIKNTDVFFNAVEEAEESIGKENKFVLFGITPTKPETGYGYIKSAENIQGQKVKPVSNFVEKPSFEKATSLIEQGYLWNSGMFVLPVSLYFKELEKYQPKILQCAKNSIKNAVNSGNRIYADEDNFLPSPAISIDYAVMQETGYASVIEMNNSGWSDVGSWEAVWELSEKDEQMNICRGEVLAENCGNSLIISESGSLITVGLTDYVVVRTQDATLVMPRSESSNLKSMLSKMKIIV